MLRLSISLLPILALAACARGPTPIVLVVVDTLRADAFSAEAGPGMPRLLGFAEGGSVFSDATAASAWTGASTAAILTGRYPDELGVRRLTDPLPDSARTLAEALRDAGYATGAVVSNAIAGPDYGYDQGYDHFDFEPYKSPAKGREAERRPQFTAERVTDRALAWLRRTSGAFFLYVHYTDPHDPYLAPSPWSDETRRDLVSERELLRLPRLRPREVADRIAAIRSAYDAEVRFVDHEIGRLLEALPSGALVAVTSDHGEEFLEHGDLIHGHSLYQELVHVPLLLRGPGVPVGRRIATPVSHTDLVPTLLELSGLPALRVSGRSLLPELRTGSVPERTLFAILETKVAQRRVARRGRWKLVRRPDGDALFDLTPDPGERSDVAAGHPEVVRELGAAIGARPAPAPGSARRGSRAAQRRREQALRALGYLK